MKNIMIVWLICLSIFLAPKPTDEREAKRMRALADNLILTSRGLTSRQKQDEIDMAEEYAPLAEFVIKALAK